MKRVLLTPKQMSQCDAATIEAGTLGTTLMERAGKAVADQGLAMASNNANIVVLAGPGNNGGDGYIAARLMQDAGCRVRVFALGETSQLTGDAKWAHDGWKGEIQEAQAFDGTVTDDADLIVDALFGAGLTRALEGNAARMVEQTNRSGAPILAVDLPSGLDGNSGKALGTTMQAASTVTFHRLKPGHVLAPGRSLCGAVSLADIGIDPNAAWQAGFTALLTGPYLAASSDHIKPEAHKFTRGHAVVVGGPPEKAGAGFLAANAALRAGAGLVTLAAPDATLHGSIGLYQALIRAPCNNAVELAKILQDDRLSVCALGPGLEPNEATRQLVYAALDGNISLVLDAGALSAFSGMAATLFERIKAHAKPVILTPHEGEFARLFGTMDGSKIEQAQRAAQQSGALVLLKGPDTVIAHPNSSPSCTFVNANAPPWLATAGSGDVLTGILTGLLAQAKIKDDDALRLTEHVALGAWVHGAAGQTAGHGMVASDLEPALRKVMKGLCSKPFEPLEAN
ncbi:MAG: NAD(P)H-hydrate dehydratase [Devosiaceae bacterium]